MDLVRLVYPAAIVMGIGWIVRSIRRRGERGKRIADSLTVTMIVAAVLALAISGKPFTGAVLLATGVAMIVAAVLYRLVPRAETRTNPSGEIERSDDLGS